MFSVKRIDSLKMSSAAGKFDEKEGQYKVRDISQADFGRKELDC